ncbi:unannotated protein [freshwater metagenome]|uniref:Unannotated protein n=1 Tax=freshwater metagenome TaxID=449393 RepID=A0A6J7XQV7_9ZZZZ|nr:hypothetical protein [Actinomycetota bacterium]
MTTQLFTQPTPSTIAARLRALRKQRRLSLADVEILSKGSVKAVVMGSYERGTRALSVKRAIQLANLFDIPLAQLLSEIPPTESLCGETRIVFDLRKLRNRTTSHYAAECADITYFLSHIAAARSDWNGEVLSLRGSDLETIALMHKNSRASTLEWLERESLIIKGTNPL